MWNAVRRPTDLKRHLHKRRFDLRVCSPYADSLVEIDFQDIQDLGARNEDEIDDVLSDC